MDIAAFLELAAAMDIRPHIEPYRFDEANQALHDLKRKKVRGAKVPDFA